jgi:alpha-D-ribose 1-methylphosphonate 5-triphosphate diphosphatase
LLPGLIELHTDNLEKHLAPRPGVSWPARPALLAHDAQIVAAGITTVFDAVALGDVKRQGERLEQLTPTLEALAACRALGLVRAEHLLHVRCELSYGGLLELFEPVVRAARPQLVSVMDHTPGQRQFTDLTKFREYYQGKYGMSDAEMERFTACQIDNHRRYSTPHRRTVVAFCRAHGIALASHDDATAAHVVEAVQDGATISEFPTTPRAAHAARELGLGVLMGAPNVVRGGSHSGNVSALELARSRLLNGLSSDYVPASLLHAAFLLRDAAAWTLPEALATVTANPATMVKLSDRGEIASGKRADILRVREHDGVPVVLGAWRAGARIL